MPTVPNTQRAAFAKILLAIQARMTTGSGIVNSPYCYIVKAQRFPGYAAERWCRLAPGPIVWQSEGGGRWDMRIDRTVVIELYTRLQVDVAGDSTAEITNEETADTPAGHSYLEEEVMEWLHLWMPMSDDLTPVPLLLEPMRLTGASAPISGDAKAPAGANYQFTTSTLTFSCLYAPPLSLQVPSGNPPANLA